ncbi:DnaJ domain-containing protein [Roseibium limicola]|uniref:DnaJ domain-containing protein n=1 Tax=Roseibium limicola TaxID=2816037 RepID=A0A939ELG4_9HYPH|nr:DnaJ domain-containing protein [Roseibium limicola]MBO0344759.1 DnaJ domain-containing protein [Roseibium limicola]
MHYLLAGFLLLGLLLFAGKRFVHANPADLARNLKTFAGVVLLALAGLLAVTGRIVLALPAAGAGLSLLGFSGLFGGQARSKPSSGQFSQVRTALLEMRLDHDTGDMSGQVLAGEFTGRSLDSLSDAELERLWQKSAADEQSQALVEAYLDRRFPGWRVDFQADGTERQRSSASSGSMTDEEAYEVLGLSPDAGDPEVRAAHRRLMKLLHPDRGGTAFLAAKLNEAKDRLLRRH